MGMPHVRTPIRAVRQVRAESPGSGCSPKAFRPPGLYRTAARPDAWVDDAGRSVDAPAVLERLARLAIPPAWVDVWASADADASVQATGVDGRGRTQYRYSPAALDLASDSKFARMTLFAAAIPSFRLQVARDIARYRQDPLAARVVTAAIVRLLDLGLLRVGNERYARDNHTYGLTTLTGATSKPAARPSRSVSSGRNTSPIPSPFTTRRRPKSWGRC